MNNIKKIIIVTATTANFVFSCFAGELEQKLMNAIIEKDSKTVKSLIDENDLDLNTKYNFYNKPDYKQTILMEAVKINCIEIVGLLIDMAKQINEQNPGFLETFLNAEDNDGWTAFHYAAFLGSFKITELLIDTAKQINKQNPKFLETFLNVKDKNGSTALHCATIGRCIEISKLLIEAAKQINEQNPGFLKTFLDAKDINGTTALDLAIEQAINGERYYYHDFFKLIEKAFMSLKQVNSRFGEDDFDFGEGDCDCGD
ncbi:ankyrin repeat domain-containing protein [Candidatus Dependentiae bacterium]|nr:ankyrin repeat domain-containing protein [Candidatus Dependentiae bacterium]MBU4386985.1 ankyrin repeat domain-containing protein [Candidatus Dependentiae bacterium]MCG2756119.1 ankyrin repeat domain-containing protein [Candidatus Dependentiae bacterium]